MDLIIAIYRITATFPQGERYSLVDQLRRAAVSVPSNIAEGQGRSRTGDYLRHLSVSVGSLSEIETQIQIARRLEYISADDEKKTLRCGYRDRSDAGRLDPILAAAINVETGIRGSALAALTPDS